MQIQAALTRAPSVPFEIATVHLEEPRPGEVLVRVVGVGLCHTDIVAQAGGFSIAMPAVFGHEGAGIVEQTGSAVTKVRPSDRVVMTFMSCGRCPSCSDGGPAYCNTASMLNYRGVRPDGSKTMRHADGPVSGSFFGQSSFGTHALASERNIVKVPEGVPLELVGMLGCGVQTGAGAVMRSMDCRTGSTIAILGGGAVGLSAVMGAVVRECRRIIIVEPHAARRDLALSLGATHTIDPKEIKDVGAAIRAICPGGVNYALDTSGVPSVLEIVPYLLAPRGTFGFVGVPPAGAYDTRLPGKLLKAMQGGFTYRGIIEGDSDPDVFLPELMQLYLDGRFPFDRLAKPYRLSQINEAVADQHRGACVKAILLP